MCTHEAGLSTFNSQHKHLATFLHIMDQSQANSAAACQHCGESVPVASERDNLSDASPLLQSQDSTSGSRKSNEISDEPSSKTLLVHGNRRLGHLFLGCINGDKRQQRVVLSKFISAWTEAAKQEFGVNIVVVRPPCCCMDHAPAALPAQRLPKKSVPEGAYQPRHHTPRCRSLRRVLVCSTTSQHRTWTTGLGNMSAPKTCRRQWRLWSRRCTPPSPSTRTSWSE